MIALVDDEKNVRLGIKTALKHEGFETCEFCNGKEAYDAVKGGLNAELFVMDIMMPVMDYIRGHFTGNENRAAQFEPPMGVPDKIRRFPGDDEYTKLRNYRAWNGMEIDENRRKRRR